MIEELELIQQNFIARDCEHLFVEYSNSILLWSYFVYQSQLYNIIIYIHPYS